LPITVPKISALKNGLQNQIMSIISRINGAFKKRKDQNHNQSLKITKVLVGLINGEEFFLWFMEGNIVLAITLKMNSAKGS